MDNQLIKGDTMSNTLCTLGLAGLLLAGTSPLLANDETNTPSAIDTDDEQFEESYEEGFENGYEEGYKASYDDNDEALDVEDDDEWQWDISLGLGYSVSQTPYVGGEQSADLIPYFNISWGPLFFDGESLGSYLYGEDDWGISATISSGMLNDSDRGESDALSDMTPLNDVVMASLSFEIEAEWGAMEASLSTDVSDEHKGTIANLVYSYPVYLEKWSLMPLIGAQWFDKKVARYYYGVSAADVTTSRALYTPSSGINYSAGINAEYEIDEQSSVAVSLITDVYSEQIRQSSIVDKSHTSSLTLAYSYQF